jgi:hypothetical protein
MSAARASAGKERDAGSVGSYAIRGNETVWDGPDLWQSSHGEASVEWRYGLPHLLKQVSAGGTRRDDLRRGEPGERQWCHQGGRGRWEYGTLRVTDRDVELHAAARKSPFPTWPAHTMAAQVCSAPEIVEAASEIVFAMRLYGTLRHNLWIHGSGREATFGSRKAARVVAAARRLDEPTSEFMREGAGAHDNDKAVIDAIARAGWTLRRPLGSGADAPVRAERIVRNCEAKRASAAPPDWFGEFVLAYDPEDRSLEGRMRRAAFSGKVVVDEWDMFWEFVG